MGKCYTGAYATSIYMVCSIVKREGWWFGLILQTWALCNHWGNHEFLDISILDSNVMPSLCELKLSWIGFHNRTIIQGTSGKSTTEWFKEKRVEVDLNWIKMLWWDLKWVVQTSLNWNSKEKWVKLLVWRNLMKSYRKQLPQIIADKCDAESWGVQSF